MFGQKNKTSWLKSYRFADCLDSVDFLRLQNLFSTETNKIELIEELFENQSFLDTARADPNIPVKCLGVIAAVLKDSDAEILLERSFYESSIFNKIVSGKQLDGINFAAEQLLRIRANSNADIYDIVEEKAKDVLANQRGGHKLLILSNMREFLLPDERARFDIFLGEEELLFVSTEAPAPEMRIAFTEAVQPITKEETIHPFIYAVRQNPAQVWRPYQETVQELADARNTNGVLSIKAAFEEARDKLGDQNQLYQTAQHAIEHCRLVLGRLPQSYDIKL